MYITDKFVYIHMQKTGGTRITEILSQLVPGELCGPRHNYLERKPYSKYVFGSIRNPFDWYVSLFAFGCTGNGGVSGWFRNDKEFQRAYSDVNNVHNFREWLELIYSPEYVKKVGNGYSDFSLKGDIGLMTWRYAFLYMEGIKTNECPFFANYRQFLEHDKENNMIDGWIRLENLSGTIADCLRKTGYIVSRSTLDSFCRIKSNNSKHLPVKNYYDYSSIKLIAEKERFILKKHNYPILELENEERFEDGVLI